jgi:hypothetical protein
MYSEYDTSDQGLSTGSTPVHLNWSTIQKPGRRFYFLKKDPEILDVEYLYCIQSIGEHSEYWSTPALPNCWCYTVLYSTGILVASTVLP